MIAAVATDRSPKIATTRKDRDSAPAFIGAEACVKVLRAKIAAVCETNCTVLIRGESGVGKELVARQIHARSPRADGPFITVDCTTLRDTLFESQLFGHVKGAFTGAEQSTLGLFRAAEGGTLVLDEIGELQPHAQAKLLRCIEDKAVVPLGAVRPVGVDVRIIAATHRDLRQMVERGTFREDLYFRLDVVRVEVPALRARQGDVRALAEHFLLQQSALHQQPAKSLSEDAARALERYDWPGNVRELRNVLEHAFVFCGNGRIEAADLPDSLRGAGGGAGSNGQARECAQRRSCHRFSSPRVVPLNVAERCLVVRALRATGGNRTRAAALLGIERHRLGRMIQRHKLPERGALAAG